MHSRGEAAEAVRVAKIRRNVTWELLAEAMGRPPVWATAALLGRHPLTSAEAQAAGSLLGLEPEVVQALQLPPVRDDASGTFPADPTLYRFYEVLRLYGPALKELIHEQCGDGIMSAVNFRLDVRRVPDPAGDRVVVVLDGKFLPYQW
ncbi:cyanase [Streptantibioticus rubrisoli]|uniref:Cyanate hydratase n=1 Tax=Streptantibioticus rubrisoli TaxID=1387313 RepID=A0ABT1PMI8_9ACTN|nr:cyanase [Streptantibioticus rubrisoli]MCQ4046559.1 cyanase [Streptantibioticus rubrisoli]